MSAILPRIWQKIDAHCHFCHSWQDLHGRMIRDMIFVAILTAFAVVLIAQTVFIVARDSRRSRPPASHRIDEFDPRSRFAR
jgi:hypothetical protein